MAKRTVVQLIDDVDGSPATQTVRFGLDDQLYEVDLNDVNADDLREVLAPFISVARHVAGEGGRRAPAVRRRRADQERP